MLSSILNLSPHILSLHHIKGFAGQDFQQDLSRLIAIFKLVFLNLKSSATLYWDLTHLIAIFICVSLNLYMFA